jgi:hypothetical protein
MSTQELTGGCQCGAIRFRVTGRPAEIFICHCRMCQKAVGGPFASFTMVPAANFQWTRGKPAEWASSSAGLRQFCSACGTPLGYRYIEGEEVDKQYLATGCFDDFQAMVPQIQIASENRNRWLDQINAIPARELDEALGSALPKLRSFQHPDHDTADWTPHPPETG